MLKKRIIPVILLRNGIIVQSRLFKRYQALGSPTAAVERLNSWACDELIYLDISSTSSYGLNRDDLNHPNFETIDDIIELVAAKCFMPLTFGGGIRSLDDIRSRVSKGADKVTLNSMAIDRPELIYEGAKEFGSQCIVASIDAKAQNGSYKVYKRGKQETDYDVIEFALEMQSLGAGEILLNSVDNDGRGEGFDLELIESVSSKLRIPVIALGGAGDQSHFEKVLKETSASAIAAANFFQHSENSVYNIKKHLFESGYEVRRPLALSTSSQNL